jgi:hypothetical protein
MKKRFFEEGTVIKIKNLRALFLKLHQQKKIKNKNEFKNFAASPEYKDQVVNMLCTT